MFDLFRSRAKAVRYLLGGLLGVVALSMVVTLIPGFGGYSGSSDDNIVAEIGKTRLTVREVQNDMQILVRSKQIPAELVQVYLPQRIDQMITERAVAYQAERMGFEVPDTELAAYIRSVLPRFFQDGKLVDKAAYEGFLQEQGMSPQEFEVNLRKQIQLKRLMDIALEGIVVSPAEVQAEFDRKNARLRIAYAAFRPDDMKSQIKPTASDLQTYYEVNKANFREPESRDVVVLVADQEKIAESLTVPPDQLRRAYQQRMDSYRTPERVKVRHVLFMTQGKSPDEANKIKAKAEAIRKQINDKNFADLAKANSDDPGSKDKGGDLGYVVKGQTVKNFEASAFSLKPGEISSLITTEYGYHIIQVMEKQPARVAPFEEVKDALATEVKKIQVADKVQNSIDQARTALAKSPKDYVQVAQQYGLEVVKADKVQVGSPVGSLGSNPELEQALASIKAGEVSQVFQLNASRLAIAEMTSFTPSRPSTFAEAEAKVRDGFVSLRAGALAAERCKQAAERAKAGGDLQKIAKELGGEFKTPGEFTLDGAIEGLGSATSLADAFKQPQGGVLGPLNVLNIQVVAKVIEKIPADPAALAVQRDQLVLSLKKKRGAERADLFQDSILAKLLKEGKVKKHTDTIKRLLAAYRG